MFVVSNVQLILDHHPAYPFGLSNDVYLEPSYRYFYPNQLKAVPNGTSEQVEVVRQPWRKVVGLVFPNPAYVLNL